MSCRVVSAFVAAPAADARTNRGGKMRTAVALTTAALAVTGLLAQSAVAPASRAACVPGPGTLGGASIQRFCGPAKALVRVGGKTYRFSGGACTVQEGFKKGEKTIAVNIGTLTLPPATPKTRYFGALIEGTKAGTYRNQAVSWELPGKRFGVLTNKVVVSSARSKKGSFTGKASSGGRAQRPARGSWTC
jgi:hypothetical protein